MVMNEVLMNSRRQCTDALKSEAVQQVVEGGIPVVDVALRCGISKYTLYGWIQRAKLTGRSIDDAAAGPIRRSPELSRLEAELRRVIEERDSLRNALALGKEQRPR